MPVSLVTVQLRKAGKYWVWDPGSGGHPPGPEVRGGRLEVDRAVDSVKGHYARRWGSPTQSSAYEVDSQEIHIYKWDIHDTDEGVIMYATNGASGVEYDGHRVEFFTGMYPGPDEIAASLAIISTFPLLSRPIGKGESITLQQPLWDGTPMCTFLVVPPRLKGFFSPLTLPDGSHIEFLQVVPIHEAELELKKIRGAEWLLGEINDQRMRLSDPFRKPIQCGLSSS